MIAKTSRNRNNREAYIGKMDRQIHAWEEEAARLESVAAERNAEANSRVRQEMGELRAKIQDARNELERLKKEDTAWPAGSREVSGSYREAKDAASHVGRDVKEK